MKKGKVFIKDVFCGIITESEEGYCFESVTENLGISPSEWTGERRGRNTQCSISAN